ncbi:MAG: 4Fe-4S binding protein, partial [Bacilli bacterium]|nr:4Fe-4S binding protein [Bacilli bacterium]
MGDMVVMGVGDDNRLDLSGVRFHRRRENARIHKDLPVNERGLDYRKQFINVIAHQRELGQGDLRSIRVLGNIIEDFSSLQFLAPQDAMSILSLRLLKIKNIRNLILEHPQINSDICIKCGECAHICPPKAMTIKKGEYPHLNRNQCIRCWCCTEVCPKNAITKSGRPLIGRIFLKNRN